MTAIAISVTFVLGFLARQLKLPPLVGFLAAGFLLFACGYESNDTLAAVADAGVALLLFSIGLKLRFRSLLSPIVWGGASLHMLSTVAVLSLAFYGLLLVGVPPFAGLSAQLILLMAFALSFSSTIFAVKIQEELGDSGSRHGRVAIGILIVQDFLAVAFLVVSKGQMPSVWAFSLLLLPAVRPLLLRIMVRCGHGEVLTLFGIVYAFAVGEAFEAVHLKSSLGALIAGAVVAGHPKADELSKTLLGFKDLLLVAFFLSIGLAGAPSWGTVGTALLLVILLPLKGLLFFALLTRFRLRARPALLSSLSLTTYSEFGLIAAAAAVAAGWLGPDWLLILAVTVAFSFIVASPANFAADRIWTRFREPLHAWQRDLRLPGDEPVDLGDAEIIVIGMGQLGVAAYDFVEQRLENSVVGIDRDDRVVQAQRAAGRNVVLGDATDTDAWDEATHGGKVHSVLLALPDVNSQVYIARRLADRPVFTATTVRHEDQIPLLKAEGVNAIYNHYSEAGSGFAEHAMEARRAQASET